MLIIVFGEMGMGKNFVGELLAEKFKFHFYDGDSALAPGQKLSNKVGVDNFVKSQLIPSIEKEIIKHPNMVVTQALYFEEHRKMILDHFKENTSVKFIHIKASAELQRERLLKRSEAEAFWIPYAARSKRRFEAPTPGNAVYSEIINDKDKQHVLKQIEALSYLFDSECKANIQPLLKYTPGICLFQKAVEKLEAEKSLNLDKSMPRDL